MFVGLRRFLRRHRLTQVVTRAVLFTVAGAAIIVFGSRFWTEYQVRKALENTAGQMQPFGALSYGKINAGFDGQLSIRNLSFRPDAMLGTAAIPLIMDEAVVDFGSYLAMLQSDQRNPPNQLEFQMNGIRLDFGITGNVITGNPAEALACGDVLAFEVVDLADMGFREARSNLRLGYRIQPAREELRLHIELSTGDAARSSFEMVLDAPGLATAIRTRNPADMTDFRLVNATIEADAARFNKKRNELCAAELEVDVEQAIEANVEAFVAMMAAAGWAPDQAFIDQYRGFMKGLGTWRIEAKPETPVGVDTLTRVDDVNWLMDRFNVRSTIGSSMPSSFSFERVARTSVADEDERGPSEGLSAVGRWVVIPLAQIGTIVGRDVTVSTVTGKRYMGRLLGVDGNEISMQARLPGGQAEIPLARTQLREVKVYETWRPEEEDESTAADG